MQQRIKSTSFCDNLSHQVMDVTQKKPQRRFISTKNYMQLSFCMVLHVCIYYELYTQLTSLCQKFHASSSMAHIFTKGGSWYNLHILNREHAQQRTMPIHFSVKQIFMPLHFVLYQCVFHEIQALVSFFLQFLRQRR